METYTSKNGKIMSTTLSTCHFILNLPRFPLIGRYSFAHHSFIVAALTISGLINKVLGNKCVVFKLEDSFF